MRFVCFFNISVGTGIKMYLFGGCFLQFADYCTIINDNIISMRKDNYSLLCREIDFKLKGILE